MAPVEVYLTIIELVEKHHLDERVGHIFAADFQVDSCILQTHALIDTTDGSLLCSNIHYARYREAGTKRSCNALLKKAYPLETKVGQEFVQSLRDVVPVVQIRNDEYARVLTKVTSLTDTCLLADSLAYDGKKVGP